MTEDSTYKFSLKAIIITLFTLITVVGGATSSIVKLSMDDKNSALEYSVSEKRKIIAEKNIELKKIKHDINLVYPIQSTLGYMTDGTEDNEILELRKKVNVLENERNSILNELVLKTYKNLDPKSELSILIKELSSDSLEIRAKAVEGLFIIREPKSINALLSYFFKDVNEATHFKYYNEWTELITSLDKLAGYDFVIEMLKSDDKYMSFWGYRYFLKDVDGKDEMKIIIKKLQPIAINNINSLVRTRSKKIISNYNEVIGNKESLHDNRSLFRLLLDIEEKVDKLK